MRRSLSQWRMDDERGHIHSRYVYIPDQYVECKARKALRGILQILGHTGGGECLRAQTVQHSR